MEFINCGISEPQPLGWMEQKEHQLFITSSERRFCEENNSLHIFQIILKGQTSLQCIVDDWIEWYKADKKQALTNLLQFFVDSSGCKGKISEVSDDSTSLIRNLTNEFNEDASDYPLCRSGVKWKRFRSGFCDFLSHLIRSCQSCIIYDGYMTTNVTSLLAALSDSQVRAFRHTSTLAVMKLMTALIEVIVSVTSKYSISRRQYEYETRKTLQRRIAERIEHLNSLNREYEENLDCLNELITFLFKAVFINRYRDIVAAIREICISELGLWMKKFPEKFLDDLHLKYVGWSLSDKIGSVRLKALQALLPFYETGKHVAKLELFTLKFKGRLVSMVNDVDSNVAAETIKLIQEMLNNFDYAFTNDDVEGISKLIYSSVIIVAHKAGEFFCLRLESKIKNTVFPEKNIPLLNYNTFFIKYVLQFHLACKLHEHVSYLVDSLLQYSGAIKDWKCMTNLLLGLDQTSEPLTPVEEKLLVEIMISSVGQTYTGVPPTGRQLKKLQTLKMLKQAKDDIQKIGMHFIVALPGLLDKFRAEAEILSTLLEIPQYFDLTILAFYPSFIMNLESLLSKLPYIIKIYHDADILGKCCKILDVLCNENYRISLKTEMCKNMIIDDIVNKYKSLLTEWSQIVDEPDDELKFSLTDSLLKISVFYSMFDLRNWSLWDYLYNFLNEVIEAKVAIPEDCVKNCIISCYFNLLWDLKNYEDKLNCTTECRIEIKFKSRFLPFIDLLKRFVSHSTSKTCSDESYIILCDLLIFLKNCFKTLGLSSFPIGNTQKILHTFIEERIFSDNKLSGLEEEALIEALHNKRVMLTSYCKLFIFGVFPVYFISHLLKYYVSSFCNFGDVLKATIIATQNIDSVDFARAIVCALMMVFEESTDELIIEENTYSLKNLADIKELAKQLSMFLVTNGEKESIAVYTLHIDGIAFALRNSTFSQDGNFMSSYHILFFEILIEFSHKLSHCDKLNILDFLKSKFPLENKFCSTESQPVFSYRNSLISPKNR